MEEPVAMSYLFILIILWPNGGGRRPLSYFQHKDM